MVGNNATTGEHRKTVADHAEPVTAAGTEVHNADQPVAIPVEPSSTSVHSQSEHAVTALSTDNADESTSTGDALSPETAETEHSSAITLNTTAADEYVDNTTVTADKPSAVDGEENGNLAPNTTGALCQR